MKELAEINRVFMVQQDKLHPFAVAYSLIGAIASITRQIEGISEAQADALVGNLIGHINHVRACVVEPGAH